MNEPLAPASRLSGRLVLIVGDLMLDHFVIGRVDRISPEAPVPVVQFDHEEYRLGGAANVAHNVAALGGRVAMVGIAGDDADAGRMREQLGHLGVDPDGIVTDPNRRTTRKLRVVTTRNQQVARIDYEDDREVTAASKPASSIASGSSPGPRMRFSCRTISRARYHAPSRPPQSMRQSAAGFPC